MNDSRFTRRDFVRTAGAAAAAGLAAPYLFSSTARADSKNDRPLFGAIGVGGQGNFIADRASGKHVYKKPGGYADCVAVADVKRDAAEAFQKKYDGKPEVFGDYRKLLDRKDVECVTIATPDHWHVHVCLDALKAGKHIYCEKPLTLTIDEGHTLIKAVKDSGKTLQVGTMQRTDMELLQFARAVATVRSGQLGKLRKITVDLPKSQPEAGGPFATQPAPETINWDMWLGQAPNNDYCPERAAATFRWWYDYSGGVLTDWGAHHLDITLWALNQQDTGPLTIDGSATKLPNVPNGYTTPVVPIVEFMFAGDIPVHVQAKPHVEGILLEGEKGRIYVDRGRITGKPIEEQDVDKSLKAKIDAEVVKLFGDNADSMGDHMGNFFAAWQHGKHPISDVASQHRAVSCCHLGNISIRLGRKLTWDPAKEEFVGDDEANAMRSRPQRAPWQFG